MPTAPARLCPRGHFVLEPGRCPQCQGVRDTQRTNHDIRKAYYTARWRRLRDQVLSDDPLCVVCKGEDRITLATEIDHIQPHGGNAQLFWDRANLQGLCTLHHGQKTRRGE